jgi:hypothetical protein
MPRADNHPAQQMVIVIAVILGATIAAAFAFGKWAVFVPVVLIPAWRFSRALEVGGERATRGWSGRRFKDYWVYEEAAGKDRPSLSLKLARESDDRYVLPVPDADTWRRTMPLWAADRRREIVARIVADWAPEDVRWPAGETPIPPDTGEE